QSVDIRHLLLPYGAVYRVFGSWIDSDSLISLRDGRDCFAQGCISPTQTGTQPCLCPRTRHDLLKLAMKILRRLLVSGTRRRDIAGALLTQTQKELPLACTWVGCQVRWRRRRE